MRADVGGDADVVGYENNDGIGVRIFAVLFDGGEFVVVRAAAEHGLHTFDEEDLEGCHQRRRTRTVEHFG